MGRGVLGVRREEKGAEVLFSLKDKSECPELVELLAVCECGELSCGEGCVWYVRVVTSRGVVSRVEDKCSVVWV